MIGSSQFFQLLEYYYKKDEEFLEKVQRTFTKMQISMDQLSYEVRLRCLSLWSLEERINRKDLIEVFKMSQEKSIIGL